MEVGWTTNAVNSELYFHFVRRSLNIFEQFLQNSFHSTFIIVGLYELVNWRMMSCVIHVMQHHSKYTFPKTLLTGGMIPEQEGTMFGARGYQLK